MDHRVSDELRAKLTREGLHAARVQSDRVNGVAGAEGGGDPHRPTAQRGEEETHAPIWNSGKAPGPKARPVIREVKRQSGHGGVAVGFDYVVHTNHAASAMPTRKRTSRARFRVITGGRR